MSEQIITLSSLSLFNLLEKLTQRIDSEKDLGTILSNLEAKQVEERANNNNRTGDDKKAWKWTRAVSWIAFSL